MILISAALYLGLHVLAYIYPAWLWGTNLFHYYPAPLLGASVVAFAVAAGLSAKTSFELPPTEFAAALQRFLRRFPRPFPAVALLSGFVLVAWSLRVQGHFLGDSAMWFSNMELLQQGRADEILWVIGLPVDGWEWIPALQGLDFLLHYHTYRIGHELWSWTPPDSYLFWSLLAGVPYLLILWGLALRLHPTSAGRVTIFGLLATLGNLQLFFGYGESYTIVNLLLAFYALLSLRRLRGELTLWHPSLCLLAAVAVHAMALALVPSWIYLVYRDNSRVGMLLRQPRIHRPLSIFLIGGGLAFYGMFYRFHHPHIWQAEVEGRYALLSLPHLANLANELLLISPFGLVWGLTMRWRRQPLDRTRCFFAWGALGTGTLICVHNVAMGGRDWDLMALPGLFLTIWGLKFLLAAPKAELWLRQTRRLILPMMLVHTGLFIGINASPERSRERLGDLLLHTPNQPRHYQNFTLGHYHLNIQDGQYGLAVEHLRAALANHPGEPPRRYSEHLNRALVGLAGDHFANHRFEEAAERCREAIQLDPTYTEGFYNLGLISLQLEDDDGARNAFAGALRLEPRHDQALYGLGVSLLRLGRMEQATQVRDVLNELNPRLARELDSRR